MFRPVNLRTKKFKKKADIAYDKGTGCKPSIVCFLFHLRKKKYSFYLFIYLTEHTFIESDI